MKASQNQKYNILYGRLSQEDERQGESNSIHNQRLLLEQYARENGFQNTLFLADDGYSGTNFERPSWKKIVEMIENGQVETLIVKDLSRLGREYLQVGYYTEIYFPQKGVRFIAVNDGVDSLVGRTAAVMLGSTETTFYTLSVYFGAAGISKTRYTLPAALFADFVGFLTASWSVRFLFGS